ncbi:sigma-70 family RNA polymerase sigma factor [Romboutsia weinsteinii]|uniref:Sigma-70 family RNA polymerase sigma factor n=1 Tax=Romboutsia weinsteinii TaxID=2020949 RepID=A0A371J589_9FIRM|nr:sigma-70 family RNA polymerase sigma factor [Romboutsia weinsteinii]RDY27848.1 sigma-70 family RNA polymerase sigma factor [Romboutsia weinsteinii]
MLKELKVKKAIKGDRQAFIDLIEPQRDKLYKIAYTYVKNEQDALDVIQETMFKAYTSIDKLQKPKYFDTWLTKILINISITVLNKNKNKTYFEESAIASEYNNIDYFEGKLDLENELIRLDEKYREVIVLRYFKDFTIKEISQVLDIPLGTAKTYLYRGLESLRKSMEERGL